LCRCKVPGRTRSSFPRQRDDRSQDRHVLSRIERDRRRVVTCRAWQHLIRFFFADASRARRS
jgi:hypothetical protein